MSCCVNPGLSDVRTVDDSASAFMSEDFPTFDRPKMQRYRVLVNADYAVIEKNYVRCLPTKATSGTVSSGMEVGIMAPAKNCKSGNYRVAVSVNWRVFPSVKSLHTL